MSRKSRAAKKLRENRVRNKIRRVRGDRLRLSVFRSARHMYAQIIEDSAGNTVVSASTLEKEVRERLSNEVGENSGSGCTVEAAAIVGRRIAEKAQEKNIVQVVLDRGGYRYYGRVKALADGARESGLVF